MKIKVIGTGAAGNKAAVNLIEKGVLSQDKILLINSTLRDVPDNYRSLAIKFSDTIGGCGKERDLSKNLCLSSIKDGTLNTIDTFIEEDDELVILVGSTEGGTGSGSVIVLARYISKVLGVAVQCFGFTGFEEDGRGLQNTVEYFQDLQEEYVIQTISNKKFLAEANNNKLKAEKLANDDFAKRISVLAANGIVDSEQNIDETDMYKVSTTPGYMTIGKASLEKIKNVEQFNKILTELIDNDKSVDISTKSQKRLAVFINANEETRDYIDYSFNVIKSKLGIPYELFQHIQYEPDQEQYISFISSGMKMPIDEVKEVYEKYKVESSKVNKEKDSFFDFASELKGDSKDSMFNTGGMRRNTIDKNSFIDDFDKELGNELTPRVKSTKHISNGEFRDTNVKVSKEEFMKENF